MVPDFWKRKSNTGDNCVPWGKFVARTIHIEVPTLFGDAEEDIPENPPKVTTIISLLLLPMVLIFFNTGLTTLGEAGVLDPENGLVEALIFLGNSPIALLISVVVATIVLGNLRGEKGSVLEKVLDSALGPIDRKSTRLNSSHVAI